ncbi:MAG: T9SS type A sorting domain-containing protein [Gemmatimonadota bacterium]|nr:MAG: T9SS type A sorting domain-containing protein [Gemmatimonadota bacterium]
MSSRRREKIMWVSSLIIFLLVLFGSMNSIAQPYEVWVDDDYCDGCGNDGHTWGYDAFDNIQDGIDAVSSSTVWVLPGTYSAMNDINANDVEVLSTGGPEVTIIDGGGLASYGFQINTDVDNVRIDGFTITDCTNGIVVNTLADGTEIHNNYIEGNSLFGVSTGPPVNAENNWWGSCTGPSHSTNPQGLGDAVSDNVDFAPWLFPCSYAFGDTCLNYMLPGNPDEYLESSDNPTEDWWAVVFRNPGGAAKITSISFRFFDGGVIDLYVFTCGDLVPEDGLCEPGQIYEVYDFLGDSLTSAVRHAFLGTGLHPIFNWEKVNLEDSCITVGPKSCFIVAWHKAVNANPRIMADDTEGAGTHSWIWNDELQQWKCFQNLEYCVDVCLDYQPGCVTLEWRDITWDPLHPCVCNDYNVTAVFYNECNTSQQIEVGFYEADWGLFFLPGPNRCSSQLYTVPAKGYLEVPCNCEYHHDTDPGNSWSRNVAVRYNRDVDFCWDEPETVYRYERRCRRTIWPDADYSGAYGSVPVPITNNEGQQMQFDVSVIDTSGPTAWNFRFASGKTDTTFWLDPLAVNTLDLIVEDTQPITQPLVVWVQALQCNGEVGVAEIEFMPYSEPSDQEWFLSIGTAQWGIFFPTTETYYDAWPGLYMDEFINPDTSFVVPMYPCEDLTPFTPYFRWDSNGTVILYAQKESFLWHQQGRQFYRNVVLDFPELKRHCFPVDSVATLYYRDCRRIIWAESRWPWDGEIVPIPVYNEEPFEDTIELSVETAPTGWTYFLTQTSMTLAPAQADTAFLTVIPQGADPPAPPYHAIAVQAVKGFCDRDTGYLNIEFMPYACLCIHDYAGKVVENIGIEDPTLMPGDTVLVNLMLENDYYVRALQVGVVYDPSYLEPDDVLLTARTANMRLDYSLSAPPGTLFIAIDTTWVSPDSIDPSPMGYLCQEKSSEDFLKVVTIDFNIIDNAPPGVCSNLYPVNVVVIGFPGLIWGMEGELTEQICACVDHGQICYGGYVFPLKCDVDADTTVSLADLFLILEHIIRVHELSDDITVPGDSLWAADANGDQVVNILDLMKCINKSVGRFDPRVAVPYAAVSLPEAVSMPSSGRMDIPVGLEIDEPLAGALFRLRYDRSIFEMGRPELTADQLSLNLEYGFVGEELWILVSGEAAGGIAVGSNPVMRLPFDVVGGELGQWNLRFEETILFTADERIIITEPASVWVKPLEVVPTVYSLSQNYPNPFNPETEIRYGLPEAGDVRLDVYNLLGQRITTLVNEHQEAGYKSVVWDGRDENGQDVSSGMYFYALTSGTFAATKRMVLIK